MNDKIIINTISKIHVTIATFLSLIILTLSIIFILLQNGIYFENISVPNLKIKTLYIKWNEKLHITVKEINIVKKSNNETKIDYKEINEVFKRVVWFDSWFERIAVQKITLNDITASFEYIDGEKGFLIASSPDFSLKSTLFFESNLFNTEIEEFNDLKRDIKITGNIIFNSNKLELTTNLNLNINNDMNLNVLANSTQSRLQYKINSKKDIKSIRHLVDLTGLDKAIRYWIIDAIDMSQVSLNSAYGWLDYSDIENGYKNFYAQATLKNLNYTYDKKLDAIHTNTTDIEFKDGVLFIYPKEAYTYGFFLDKSWLKIDFTKENVLLTLDLKFNAMLNKDLLYLLNRYKIELPFLQNSGEVKTDLQVFVALKTVDVSAKGSFYTKKANFTYLGLDIDIFNTTILLDNYDVKIDNMYAKYKDIASSYVDVALNTKAHKGYINFDVKTVAFQKEGLALKKPIKVIYDIAPKQDMINIDASTWKYNDTTLKVDSLAIPFYLDKLLAVIPSTLVKIPKVGSAYISGKNSFKSQKLNLDIDLLDFIYDDIKLTQKNSKLKLQYQNSELNIKSAKKIDLTLNGLKSTLNKTSLKIKNNKLYIKYGGINIDNTADALFDAQYDLKTNHGYVNLYKLKIRSKALGEVLSHKKRIKLNVSTTDTTTYISSKNIDLNFVATKKAWKLKLNSLSKIYKNSRILKNYLIKNGSVIVSKKTDSKKIEFNAKTAYPHKILVLNNKPIEKYIIDGTFNTKTKNSSININDSIKINIANNIDIKAKKIGINIGEVFDFFNNKPTEKITTAKTKKITFSAVDSFIYVSKERHAISDKIHLAYDGDITTAQLTHKQGNAGFILDKGNYHLYGENFNNKFMGSLFASSEFRGGKLDFTINGNTKKSHGVFHIEKTTIVDYKILNNILAFVNTIPALVTFSLPGYNKNGLAVESAYVNFDVNENNQFDIKDVSLISKEIKIVGRGKADYAKNSIDMELNLKTDLGSTFSKIPVVGYIFLDNENISTSLKITGKLNDPKVKTRLAQDIVVAPLNIIKRTLLLPLHLFSDK